MSSVNKWGELCVIDWVYRLTEDHLTYCIS